MNEQQPVVYIPPAALARQAAVEIETFLAVRAHWMGESQRGNAIAKLAKPRPVGGPLCYAELHEADLRKVLDRINKLERDSIELRDRRTDSLNIRGILHPADRPGFCAVPLKLLEENTAIAPAIDWLVAENERLREQLTATPAGTDGTEAPVHYAVTGTRSACGKTSYTQSRPQPFTLAFDHTDPEINCRECGAYVAGMRAAQAGAIDV